MNYNIYDEYIDIVSGGASNRPELSHVMMLDASKGNLICCYSLHLTALQGRGTRKTIQYLQMLDDYESGTNHTMNNTWIVQASLKM
ncbi:MAG: hypothetical protein MZV63_38280 [Marinilabiliales bacterium]|nr:hypothetical protein [Marinilabiliales bacterium]